MKKYILSALALISSVMTFAQTESLVITHNNGQKTVIPVAEIKEMTFGVETESPAQSYAGTYTGKQTVTVGGMYSYSTDLAYTLTADADGKINVSIPEYSLTNTMMGDLTLGAITISGLEYDEAKGGFYRFYANDGLTQHFRTVNNGQAGMDAEYPLGGESSILIKLDGNKITVENPFKLGAMPLSLTAAFEGTK